MIGTLVSALKDFVAGVSKAAGFFSVMEQELKNSKCKAQEGKDARKFLYYNVMKKEAKDMKSICRVFHSALPDLQKNFSLM